MKGVVKDNGVNGVTPERSSVDKTSSGSFRPRLVPSIAKTNVVHVKLDVY